MKTTLMTFLRVAGSIGAAISGLWSPTRSLCVAVGLAGAQFRRRRAWRQERAEHGEAEEAAIDGRERECRTRRKDTYIVLPGAAVGGSATVLGMVLYGS